MNTLELFLITYNRKEKCRRTLQAVLAPDSPVKALPLTILDNCSTDGTAEMLAEFAAQHPNIRLLRHAKNIGGNANITRAYELARKPYVWVVCDDDSFRWDAWDEIAAALQSGRYDLLLTRKDDLRGTSDIARIYRQCTFVPAGIYRTAIITGGVLMNMYNNVPNMFPHLALISEILNKKGTIFLPQGEIMDVCTFDAATSGDGFNTRGSVTYSPPPVTHMFWTVGFINSTQMLADKKLRAYILDHVGNHGFFGYIWSSFRKNYTHYGGYPLNEAYVRSGLGLRQRTQFDAARLLLKPLTLFQRKKRK